MNYSKGKSTLYDKLECTDCQWYGSELSARMGAGGEILCPDCGAALRVEEKEEPKRSSRVDPLDM